MKAASITQIKKELGNLSTMQLASLLNRLIKHKIENKELISYLLFDADDITGYLSLIKQELDETIQQLDFRNGYLTKKGLRKCLRNIAKYSRFMASKDAEVELLVHFCKSIKSKGLNINSPRPIQYIFQQTIEKIGKLLPSVHDDLQNDYIYEILNITK